MNDETTTDDTIDESLEASDPTETTDDENLGDGTYR
jgi:hypothetical protein